MFSDDKQRTSPCKIYSISWSSIQYYTRVVILLVCCPGVQPLLGMLGNWSNFAICFKKLNCYTSKAPRDLNHANERIHAQVEVSLIKLLCIIPTHHQHHVGRHITITHTFIFTLLIFTYLIREVPVSIHTLNRSTRIEGVIILYFGTSF